MVLRVISVMGIMKGQNWTVILGAEIDESIINQFSLKFAWCDFQHRYSLFSDIYQSLFAV
jgi:hypothetical protein